MKRILAVPTVVALIVGVGFAGYRVGVRHPAPATSGSRLPAAQRKILYWQSPMDPSLRSERPGRSPMGMDLVPVYSDGDAGTAADVQIQSAVVNNLGVRTAPVRRGPLARSVKAVGYVGYDENSITSINTRADGWIEKLAVKSAGDPVRRGQRLYELFSPKLATAEREYLTALASGSAGLIAASRERMRALGFTAGQIRNLTLSRKVHERVARYADGDAVVVNLGVSEGAYVMPSTQVMKLADLRSVWVQVEADESDAALLHVAQSATARFDAFPGQTWHGDVDYVYPDLNAVTRTIRVRLRFANPDLRLQPNMFAHVRIQTRPHNDALYIPSQALIRTGHSQRVIVALGQGRFDVCPVEVGFTVGDQVQILKGLHAGQRVVTSAQFMIDSEANVDAAALRLGSGRPACGQAPSPARAHQSNDVPSGTALAQSIAAPAAQRSKK